MLSYAHKFTSARLLTWWHRTFPDRRWWTSAVIAIGTTMRQLRGDAVTPKHAAECERVRWQLVEDMSGGGE